MLLMLGPALYIEAKNFTLELEPKLTEQKNYIKLNIYYSYSV